MNRTNFTALPAAMVAALLASLAMTSCLGEDPQGTEVENEIGTILLSDGRPAPYATVRILHVDAIPQAADVPGGIPPALVTRTDTRGRYRAGNLPSGKYNVLADLDGAFAYQDSLDLGEGSGPIPPDTLADPGTVSGVAAVQPQHDPRTVTVQILGTHRFANVDSGGRFEFRDLAAGQYRARLVTTLPDYTPTFTSFTVSAGAATALPDTLDLIYTGIPAVTGLRADYDTLTGLVRLSWHPVTYRGFLEYAVFRDTLPVRTPSAIPAGSTRDTAITDRIRFDSEAPLRLRYSVRVRDQNQALGGILRPVDVQAAPPSLVATSIRIEAPGRDSAAFTVGDTARLRVTVSNPTRRIRSLAWFRSGSPDTLRGISAGGREAGDSLAFPVGNSQGILLIRVEALDEAGTRWKDSLSLRVGDDVPSVDLEGPRSPVRVGDTIALSASIRDLGRIVRREWSLGGSAFVPTSRPDTAFAAPFRSHPDGAYLAICRATDEDGRMGLDTLRLTVLPWKGLRNPPLARTHADAAALGGKIYLLGGRDLQGNTLAKVEVYDPDRDVWDTVAPMPTPRGGLKAVSLGGKLYAIGGFTGFTWTNRDLWTLSSAVEAYDPASDRWDTLPRLPNPRAFHGAAALDGKIYVLEGVSNSTEDDLVLAYDTASRAWSAPFLAGQFKSRSRYGCATAVLGDRIYLAGGSGVEVGAPNGGVVSYHPATGSATAWKGPAPQENHLAAAAAGGKLRLFGLSSTGAEQDRNGVSVLDPAALSLSRTSQMPRPLAGQTAVELGGRVYLMGGYRPTGNGAPTFQDVSREAEMFDPSWEP